MWAGTSTLSDLLSGDHQVTVVADAWYRGELTRADLPVVEATFEARLDDASASIRSSLQLEVDDADGELVPVDPTDPLAPFGQSVVVALDVSAGPAVERVPVGELRIEESPSSGGWRSVVKRGRVRWIPTGGTVTVPLVDNLARINDAEFWGLMAPAAGTVLAEVDRLCRDVPQVRTDWTDVPNRAITPGTAYGESRIEAVQSWARTLGRVLATTRDGAVTMLDATIGSPVLDVTTAESWIDTRFSLEREGLINAVVTTGYQSDDSQPPPTGIARIIDGPLGWLALGPRIRRQHSDFYKTRAQAQAGAETYLATLTKNRTVEFTVQATFDPRVDVLDTHRVTIRPDGSRPLVVSALVVGVAMNLMEGGPMTVTYRAPLEAVL